MTVYVICDTYYEYDDERMSTGEGDGVLPPCGRAYKSKEEAEAVRRRREISSFLDIGRGDGRMYEYLYWPDIYEKEGIIEGLRLMAPGLGTVQKDGSWQASDLDNGEFAVPIVPDQDRQMAICDLFPFHFCSVYEVEVD
jgi:hypothetical protein